jgi:hypothetical protein
MPKKAIINLIGALPDGVLPSVINDISDLDKVYIYYRNDGNLYLYDTALGCEFNLFELET